MNELKKKVFHCDCKRCRAIVYLINQRGAVLIFSKSRAGRLCELAVVAATEATGMGSGAVVQARREYAKHLGLILSGPISNSDQPLHIHHAVTNSNHNKNSSNRINIGQAVATLSDDVFRLI